MRNRLLALAIVGATALFFAIASAGATTPGSSYQWQQPGTAPVTTAHAQPQFSYATGSFHGLRYASSSYAWTQPGTAPVSTPHAQPR